MLGGNCSPCCAQPTACVHFPTLFSSFPPGSEAPLTWGFVWGSSPPITTVGLPVYWNTPNFGTATHREFLNNVLSVRLTLAPLYVPVGQSVVAWFATARFNNLNAGVTQDLEMIFECGTVGSSSFGTRIRTEQFSATLLEVDGVQFPRPAGAFGGFCVRAPEGTLYSSCEYTNELAFAGSFGMTAEREPNKSPLPTQMAFSINITDPTFFARQPLP